MLDTKPLLLEDDWPVSSLEAVQLDVRSVSELAQWIEETYEKQKNHMVLIVHSGHLVYELYSVLTLPLPPV